MIACFECLAGDWSMVTMEMNTRLIEMDSAVIDQGTDQQLVSAQTVYLGIIINN